MRRPEHPELEILRAGISVVKIWVIFVFVAPEGPEGTVVTIHMLSRLSGVYFTVQDRRARAKPA